MTNTMRLRLVWWRSVVEEMNDTETEGAAGCILSIRLSWSTGLIWGDVSRRTRKEGIAAQVFYDVLSMLEEKMGNGRVQGEDMTR